MKIQTTPQKNILFEFTMKVLANESTKLSDGLKGAYVTCYASALDYQSAVKNGIQAITQEGFSFEDIQGDVREIPTEYWSDYVKSVWPEYSDQMPSSEQLLTIVEYSQVFFAPFIGFSK